METIIKVSDVSVILNKKKILESINIGFEEKHIYGIVGRNGSGKTMLMKCICGFVRPTKGEIRVYNDIIGKTQDFPKDTGMLIETPGFIPYYSGYKNLKLLAGLNKRIDSAGIKKAMESVGLDASLKLPVRKYSLGMRQRLGIAQAVMENPSILILDEPFNGLDTGGVDKMRTYLQELKKEGKTILLVSHSHEDISILCDYVYKMEAGKIERSLEGDSGNHL